jgi:hypothetical protein
MEEITGTDLFEITNVKFNGRRFQRRQELIKVGEYCKYIDMKKLEPIWYDTFQGIWHVVNDNKQSVLETEWQKLNNI